jgi:drug/metabolite transporter (DMT)-like permease
MGLEQPGAQALEPRVSTRILTRTIVSLIAAWSFVYGAVLVFFHEASTGALGAGVEDVAARRLVGAHMLLLVPVYGLIAWRPRRYPMLHWLPFGGQLAVFLAVGYSMLAGAIGVSDGIVPVAVSSIFMGLLAFIWFTEERSVARARLRRGDASRTGSRDHTPSNKGLDTSD